MEKELTELDAHLREKRPEYYHTLQPGLSEPEIAGLEQEYGIPLPADLKSLYRWKNGQDYSCYKSFVNNSVFEPLESVLIANREYTDMIGYDFEIENWWNESWLPLFSNGGGSSICYDLQGIFTGNAGQLVEYWNEDNDRNVIAPGLVDFLHALNAYYRETPVAEFDSYFDITGHIQQWKQEFFVVNKLETP